MGIYFLFDCLIVKIRIPQNSIAQYQLQCMYSSDKVQLVPVVDLLYQDETGVNFSNGIYGLLKYTDIVS